MKTTQESRQHLLNDIIEPYFDELQTAYSAYLATLRKAKQMLEKGRPFPQFTERSRDFEPKTSSSVTK